VPADEQGIALNRKTFTDAILAAGGLQSAVVRAPRLEFLAGPSSCPRVLSSEIGAAAF
jgi:hypothetical protein